MLKGCKLHHVGYTVADIQTTAAQFAEYGYQQGPTLYEETLQVEICYLSLPGHDAVELICQHNDASLERQLLKANGVMPYHLAFEAENFDQTCRDLDAMGYQRLFDPVAVGVLEGMRICYFHHPGIGYIEIVGT